MATRLRERKVRGGNLLIAGSTMERGRARAALGFYATRRTRTPLVQLLIQETLGARC